MTYALGTSRGAITKAPLLLIDLETEEGVTGRSYLCSAICRAAAPAIAGILDGGRARGQGRRASRRSISGAKLAERFALIGVQGIVRMAMAGLRRGGLGRAGDRGRPAARDASSAASPKRIPAYNSCGLGLMAPDEVADEAEKLLARRLPRREAPARLSDAAEDLAALRAVRRRIGDDVAVMVDYNQALSRRRGARARPRARSRRGSTGWRSRSATTTMRATRRWRASSQTPIQIGENFSKPAAMAAALAAGACDYVMPDLERIGGVTGWQRAAALAAAHRDRDVVAPVPRGQRASARGDADLPLARICRLGRHDRAEPLRIVDGYAVVPDRPGNGLVWDKAAVEKYRIT